jgi:hypothetical protein
MSAGSVSTATISPRSTQQKPSRTRPGFLNPTNERLNDALRSGPHARARMYIGLPPGGDGVHPRQHEARRREKWRAEFDFRYNNRIANGIGDEERAEKALKGIKDKRLTY